MYFRGSGDEFQVGAGVQDSTEYQSLEEKFLFLLSYGFRIYPRLFKYKGFDFAEAVATETEGRVCREETNVACSHGSGDLRGVETPKFVEFTVYP